MRNYFTITRQQFWIATIVSICVIAVAVCYAWMTWNGNEDGTGYENQETGTASGQELQADGNPGMSGEDGRLSSEVNGKPADVQNGSGNSAVVSSPGNYLLPVEGEIFRGYSTQELTYFPTLNQYMTHDGIDILASEGTEVKAAADGLVSKVTDDKAMGKTLWISHEGEVTTVYANLAAELLVEEGDVVTKGQTIGKAGNTSLYEKSDEPHVHVEVMAGGKTADPKNYFNY